MKYYIFLNLNHCFHFVSLGFGYHFNSLATAAKALRRSRHTQSPPENADGSPIFPTPNTPPASKRGFEFAEDGELEEENELARAFGIIFSTARQFRVFTILQVWFPFLRRFVSIL